MWTEEAPLERASISFTALADQLEHVHKRHSGVLAGHSSTIVLRNEPIADRVRIVTDPGAVGDHEAVR
jgi:hypothetical protein